jgi:prepilin-type N-terminal cleavage/methylation domain-containing protein
MMFRKLGLINKSQKGFTAIEMLVAFAATGIISGGITATLFQVIDGSARSNNHMMAVRQAQNAGYFVSRDVQAAQSIIYDDPTTPGVTEFLTLYWIDWDDTENTVRYTLEGTDLWRDCNGQRIPVAQCIDFDPANFDFDPDNLEKTSRDFADIDGDNVDDILIFRVAVTVGSGSQEQTETKEYGIVSRAM